MSTHTNDDATRPPDLITTSELADMLRTSPETIRYWRHTGYGPKGFKLGRRVLYSADEIDRWLAAVALSDGAQQ